MAYRRFLRLTLFALALLTALFGALLLARIPVAEYITVTALASAGFDDAKVDIRHFGLDNLTLKQIAFTRNDAHSRYHLQANDVLIKYRPALLAERRLDRVQVSKLILRQEIVSTPFTTTETTKTAGSALLGRDLLALLHTDWAQYVPLNQIDLEHVNLDGEVFGPLALKPLSLRISNSGNVFKIEARLTSTDQERTLSLKQTHDSLAVVLQAHDKAVQPALQISMKPSTDGAEFLWTLQPTATADWLDPLVAVADIGSGTPVSGSLKLELTADAQLHATLNTATDRYNVSGFTLQRPSIALSITTDNKLPPDSIRLLSDSSIHVAKIESATGTSTAISVDDFTMQLQADSEIGKHGRSVQGRLSVPRLAVTCGEYAFIIKNVNNRISTDGENLRLHTTFSPDKLPGNFSLDLSHSLATAYGSANLLMPAPIVLGTDDAHLGQLLTSWPFAFDLASGSIRVSGKAAWSNTGLTAAHAGVELADIGGYYGQVLFSGLNFRHDIDVLPTLRSTKAGELTLAQLDAGVAIDDISARVYAGPGVYGVLPKLHVNGLVGHIFDGTFTAEPFQYDLSAPANSLTIHAHGINLAEVVATQQFGDLEVTGRIDGDLPVETNPFGVFINNGNLHNSTPEGIIRYRPATGAGGLDQNPLTGIALKALSDFHYDTLKARADYVPDGTLTLGFELKGTSPPLQTGRPVHLNINTQQNLLSLLKSIRYVDGLNQELDKSVREMYQHR